jgi:hypothetical protein
MALTEMALNEMALTTYQGQPYEGQPYEGQEYQGPAFEESEIQESEEEEIQEPDFEESTIEAQYLDCDTLIIETVLGSILISGIKVYVIRRNEGNNTSYVYITNDLDMRIPIGVVIHVPGYNEPYIYFDELEGPHTFPHFSKNMFNQSLNWVDINIGSYEEVVFLRELFESTKEEAHRFLNKIIIDAQNQVNDEYDVQFPLDM